MEGWHQLAIRFIVLPAPQINRLGCMGRVLCRIIQGLDLTRVITEGVLSQNRNYTEGQLALVSFEVYGHGFQLNSELNSFSCQAQHRINGGLLPRSRKHDFALLFGRKHTYNVTQNSKVKVRYMNHR